MRNYHSSNDDCQPADVGGWLAYVPADLSETIIKEVIRPIGGKTCH